MRLITLAFLAMLGGCAGLPAGVERPASSALTDTAGTRLGVVIESARLAAGLSETLDAGLPRDAYQVHLENNQLVWVDGDARHTPEPGAGLLKRAWIGFLSLLPIEWLL